MGGRSGARKTRQNAELFHRIAARFPKPQQRAPELGGRFAVPNRDPHMVQTDRGAGFFRAGAGFFRAGVGFFRARPGVTTKAGTIERSAGRKVRLQGRPEFLHAGSLNCGGQQHRTGPEGAEGSRQRLRPGTIRLIHHHEVGHLEESGLRRLHRVAKAGSRHRHPEISEFQDRNVPLPHARRLQQDALRAARGQQPQDRRHLGSEAGFAVASRHAPEENRVRTAGEPHPVAEERPSGPGAGGIHREHRHRAPFGDKPRGEAMRQFALPNPRRTGQGDHPSPVRPVKGQGRPARPLRATLHQGDGAGQGAAVAGRDLAEQPGAKQPGAGVRVRFQGRLPVSSGDQLPIRPRMGRAMISRWISEVPSPMVMSFASRR